MPTGSSAQRVDHGGEFLRHPEALRIAALGGPGSLYTSVLPPLLVPQIRDALQQSRALKIFVLNLMTEPGETEGFDAIRHLEVVRDHVEMPPFDYVIFNTSPIAPHLVTTYADAGSFPITVTTRDIAAMRKLRLQPLGARLASEGPQGKIGHHPARLAATIAACAGFDGRCASRPCEENNVRTFL